jgi:hypothetical protein
MKNSKCAYCGSPPGESHTCQNCGSANPDIEKIKNLAAICFEQAFNNSPCQEKIQTCLGNIESASAQGKFETFVYLPDFSHLEQKVILEHLKSLGFSADMHSYDERVGWFKSKDMIVIHIKWA